MANEEHLALLKKGADAWNEWREKNFEIQPDLSEANLIQAVLIWVNLSSANLRGTKLHGADLQKANFSKADLSGANLRGAILYGTNFSETNLNEVNLQGANLSEANLQGADLSKAKLSGANLYKTNFSKANLSEVDFTIARLIETNFEEANLTGCQIYGISVWGVELEGANQSNLVITPRDEPTITVDNLEVAQFIYLLLNNQKIREVIDTITSKVVLILGRFTPERKAILDAIREELRSFRYIPVLFDFEKPGSRDFIETVSTLAHLARFVIADFTDPKIVLEEVPHIVRNIAVPVQPLLLKGSGKEPVTLYDLRRNHRSLLDTYQYKDIDDLLVFLKQTGISHCEAKAKELGSG